RIVLLVIGSLQSKSPNAGSVFVALQLGHSPTVQQMAEYVITVQETWTMSSLDAIAVFVKVVEAGSFSVAARRLGMPKTTVSAKVAGLEKRLGVRLIARTTRKLRMTEAGETYFRHCAIATREVELGEAALQSAKAKPSGILRVTAPADLGRAILPRIAKAYAAKYPDVAARLGQDPATLLRSYAKRTHKADISAASVIGTIAKAILKD